MSSGEESNKEEELAVVNLENVKRISETYKPSKGKGKNKKGTIRRNVVQEVWKDRLSPRFFSRLMSVMFPEESNEVSFLSFYTIYKNLAEPETEIMFRALTIYHIATIHEPPFNYEQANEYPNASYKAIKDYVCDVVTSYLHAIIHCNLKEAHAWLDLRASNTLIDGNLVASYMLKDLETHRNEVSIGSLEIWLEKNEMYYTVSEQLYLFLFGVNSCANVKPLLPLPLVRAARATKTLLALPDVLLLNSKLPKRAQRWTLAYMLDSRSQNWETFKQAIYGKGQTIIVIQDANGDIFGMYGSNKWFPAEGFFGNGECFLFTLKPDVNIYEGSGRDNNFQLFTESGIGMGGTTDRLGLFVQSDTIKGTTSLACSTFREFWPLARDLEFKITQIEIWTVDDVEALAVVDQDIGELINKTQYMVMEGDEMLNEKRTLKLRKQAPDSENDNTPNFPMAICGLQVCCGECAVISQPDRQAKYNQGMACCSKRCAKKRGAYPRQNAYNDLNNPCGKGDGNTKVCTSQRYPRQEEENHQCRHKYPEDKVTIKRENRIQRISCDALQTHGGAGFIHPSLAAEENERNAREGEEAKAASPIISGKLMRNKISRKNKSLEEDSRLKTYYPTTAHNKTQVGESRLMKPTCRSYKHENKCACVVRKSCNCRQDITLSASSDRSGKTFLFQKNQTINRVAGAERVELKSTKTAKTNHDGTSRSEGTSVYAPDTTADFTADSSSTVLIEIIESSPNEAIQRLASTRRTSTQRDTAKASPVLDKERQIKKADTHSKGKLTNSNMIKKEGKSYQGDPMASTKNIIINDTSERIVMEETDKSWQDMIQAKLDCRCSNSSDCNDIGVADKTCAPASACCCNAKLSNYLTNANRTDASGIPLSEISSSVCSCILDNKNKITATSTRMSLNSSKKETQNLSKSIRKSCGSSQSIFIPHTNRRANKMKTPTTSPNDSSAIKKQTQLLNKPRWVSRRLIPTIQSNKQNQPVPPTCLTCKTLVGTDGCLCKAKYMKNNVTRTAIQTSYLVQTELGDNSVTLKNEESRGCDVINAGRPVVPGGSRMDVRSISKSISTDSRNTDRAPSQASQIKQEQKKSCKTSCKCSLSRAYFPSFPEDLIREGALEDCDCASYNNLRFPVIVETPPQLTPEPSVRSRTSIDVHKAIQREEKKEIKEKDCGCNDDDNTIIILNVSKCSTAETVQKIVQELEVKNGDVSSPNVKSLVLKCKDFADPSTLHYSPCTSKGEAEREALRQQIEKILKRNSREVQPVQEDQTQT